MTSHVISISIYMWSLPLLHIDVTCWWTNCARNVVSVTFNGHADHDDHGSSNHGWYRWYRCGDDSVSITKQFSFLTVVRKLSFSKRKNTFARYITNLNRTTGETWLDSTFTFVGYLFKFLYVDAQLILYCSYIINAQMEDGCARGRLSTVMLSFRFSSIFHSLERWDGTVYGTL